MANQDVLRECCDLFFNGSGTARQLVFNVAQAAYQKGAGAAVDSVLPHQIVAWRDPSNRNPGQAVTFDPETAKRWPHIYTEPLCRASPSDADVQLLERVSLALKVLQSQPSVCAELIEDVDAALARLRPSPPDASQGAAPLSIAAASEAFPIGPFGSPLIGAASRRLAAPAQAAWAGGSMDGFA